MIATTITIPITPTHIPALKIEPIAAQLLMEKAIRKNSKSIFFEVVMLIEFKILRICLLNQRRLTFHISVLLEIIVPRKYYKKHRVEDFRKKFL